MSSPTAAPPARAAQVRRVLRAILFANLTVVAVKIIVGLGTGSLAVAGDAMHSSVDVINNLFALAVMRIAAKGPDAEHPYGHAKFETLGALLIVVFLSVSLFQLLQGAARRLLEAAPPPEADALALALLGGTLLVNLAVVTYETRAARRLDSALLAADAAHTRVDVYITSAVILGLFASRLGEGWTDPVLAIVVAGLVGKAGFEIVRRAIPSLVDERAFDASTIRRQAESVAGVVSAYAIRSRSAGALQFAELTIAVDGRTDVAAAHDITDAVESRLREQLNLHEIVVHVEPC